MDLSVFDSLKCSLKKRDHYLISTIYILPCYHDACKECLMENNGKGIECDFPNCGRRYKKLNINQLKVNSTKELIQETYKEELLQLLKQEYELMKNEFDIERIIAIHCDFILNEMDIRIESLKNDIEKQENNLNKQLENIIKKIKQSTSDDQNKLQLKFRELCQNDLLVGYKTFKDIQSEILIPSINFKKSSQNIKDNYVGKLRMTEQKEGSFVKKITPNDEFIEDFPNKNLSRMAYDKKLNRILMCDSKDSKLIVLTSETYELIYDINPGDKLLYPVSICADNSNGNIFIGDYKTQSILIFDKNLEFIKEIGEKVKPCFIEYDEDNDTLYVSEEQSGRLHTFEVESGRRIKIFTEILNPVYFKIEDSLMYVICGNRKFSRCWESENNRLYVIDKITGEIENTIILDEYLNFRGIYVLNGYVYTTANERISECSFYARKHRVCLGLRRFICINSIKESTVSNKKESKGKLSPNTSNDYIDGRFLIGDETSDFIFIENKLIACNNNNNQSSIHSFNILFN